MIRYRGFQLPPELAAERKRALRLSWLTIVFLATIIVPLAALAGSAQVVKAAWLEDMISLVPPIVILVTWRLTDREPTTWYPMGHVGAVSIGYLVSAVALFALGVFIIVDSAIPLVRGEHPSVGTLEILGHLVWEGWVIVALLVYSVIPPLVLGRLKLRVAEKLHDKQLYADAKMNKADWLTGAVSVIGIVAVGFGWWWVDPIAALIIGVDVLRDGVVNTRSAMADLLGRTPRTIDDRHLDPLVDEAQQLLRGKRWVARAEVRMREKGSALSGTALVVPRPGARDVLERAHRASEELRALSWRIVSFDVVAAPCVDAELITPDPHVEAYPVTHRERVRPPPARGSGESATTR